MTTYLIDELEDNEKSLDQVLRDGDRVRFPMSSLSFRDSMSRDIAQHFSGSPLRRDAKSAHAPNFSVTDAFGGTNGLNRPGFRHVINDAAGRDARQQAEHRQQIYDQYDYEIQRAYLDADNTNSATGQGSHTPIGGQEGDVCTVRGQQFKESFGSPGHLRRINGLLVCVPDAKPKSKDAQGIRDHASIMREVYDEYSRTIQDAWRNVR